MVFLPSFNKKYDDKWPLLMFLRQPRLEDRILVNNCTLYGRNLSMQGMTKQLRLVLKETVQAALNFLNLGFNIVPKYKS